MKTKLIGLLVAGLLAAPLPGIAATLTLDEASIIVSRPISGSVDVIFFGTLTLGPGEHPASVSIQFPFTSSGDFLTPHIPSTVFDLGDAARFFFTVDSTAALGLYEFNSTLVDPALFGFSYFEASGHEKFASPIPFSVHVIALEAPEPAMLALLGVGLAGLGFARRRRH